CGGRVY
ncbi:hypothetical protein CFC21_069431, partial [Triticum aestivum]